MRQCEGGGWRRRRGSGRRRKREWLKAGEREREREREREEDRSRQGLGNPSGNLRPSPLGSFGRSDDLSKIRTSIVHRGLSLNQTPSHPLRSISRHRPSAAAALDSTPETKGLAGTRGDPLFHFSIGQCRMFKCVFESDRPPELPPLHCTQGQQQGLITSICDSICLSVCLSI